MPTRTHFSLNDSSGTVESYDYLGLGTVVRRGHSQPGVDLTYIKQSGESNGSAGDQYAGLDAFGRVTDQRWLKTSNGNALSRHQYGYDRDSNRLWRDDLVNTAFGEVYAYDGLNQVTSFDRGTLNGTKTGLTGSASRSQDWDFDAVGNWDSVTTDASTQTRTANRQNEITSVSGATTPTFDASGNMTQAETGLRYVYDAWNRLVAVKDSPGTTTLKTYGYDGLNRRVSETAGGTTTDLFYSDSWQVLEEKVGSNTTKRYVWSPVYVDAMVLRDRDTDGNGTLDERLWVMQDANFNVVGLVDGSGSVVERYAYDPFGGVTVYSPDYSTVRSSSSYSWGHYHQGLRRDFVSVTDDNRERIYFYDLGRFGQLDPLGLRPDVNAYRYVGNGPGNAVDPSGTDIIFLYENSSAALGHGHAAVLIGSDTAGWRLFSHYPQSATGGFISIAAGVISRIENPLYKTLDEAKRATAKFTHSARWYTNTDQDKKAIAAGEIFVQNRQRYYLHGENCVDIAAKIAGAGGVSIPLHYVSEDHSRTTWWMTFAPDTLHSIGSVLSPPSTPPGFWVTSTIASPKNTWAAIEKLYKTNAKGAPDIIGAWSDPSTYHAPSRPEADSAISGYYGTGGQWIDTTPATLPPRPIKEYDPTDDF